MANDTVDASDLERYRTGDPGYHIAGALRTVRSYCGWHISPERTEVATVATHGSTFFLKTMHLVSVVSVTSRSIALPLNRFAWDPNGTVRSSLGFYPGGGGVTVEFSHGYQTMPEDVRQVVTALAQGAIDNPSRRLRTEVPGTLNDTFAGAGAYVLTDHDRALLDPYRLPYV